MTPERLRELLARWRSIADGLEKAGEGRIGGTLAPRAVRSCADELERELERELEPATPELERLRANDLARARAASLAMGIAPVNATSSSTLERVRLRLEQNGGRVDLDLAREEWDRGLDGLARQMVGLGGRGGDA